MAMKVEITGTKKVIVAGAGYAGLTAAIALDGKVDLTLIDRKGYHEMLTRAHLVAGGMEEVQENVIPLNQVLKGRNTRVVRSTIRSIDLNERRVSISTDGDGGVEHLYYDHLILALGSEVNYGVKGARENALGFRSMTDALKIQKRFKAIKDGGKVVIVGGGATGVSLAGALAEMGTSTGRRIRITVLEALDRILQGWDEYTVSGAERVLSIKGVDIVKRKRAVEVKQGSIILDDGTEMPSDLTIWTTGVKGSSVELNPEVGRVMGRIPVDRFSRIEGYDDAYAIGDISAFRLDDGKSYAPQLAQIAIRQGYGVARNLLRIMDGYSIRPISLRVEGTLLSLGSECVGVVNGIRFDGEICRCLEEFIAYNYKRMIHGDHSAMLAYDDDPIARILTLSRAVSYVSVCYSLLLISRLCALAQSNCLGMTGSIPYHAMLTSASRNASR